VPLDDCGLREGIIKREQQVSVLLLTGAVTGQLRVCSGLYVGTGRCDSCTRQREFNFKTRIELPKRRVYQMRLTHPTIYNKIVTLHIGRCHNLFLYLY
jgi:hypothetical protein